MPRVAIVGAGATGTRVARQLSVGDESCELVLVDRQPEKAETAARAIGGTEWHVASVAPSDCEVVVLTADSGAHASLARRSIAQGQHVVSVSDGLADIRRQLLLDEQASASGSVLIIGAGMMPGLSDVLVAHGAWWFDELTEVHVSKFGTGGPGCARQHHRSLKGICFDWRDGDWVRRAGGSGRELEWFPPPVQAADCYRAALGDPLLLVRKHPSLRRITARMAATRRDRMTMHLPMLRTPHPEGLLGAVRVELRGIRDGQGFEVILGASERPAVAAGAVAAAAAMHMVNRGDLIPGARGLAEEVDPLPFLHKLISRGIRPEIFVGST